MYIKIINWSNNQVTRVYAYSDAEHPILYYTW